MASRSKKINTKRECKTILCLLERRDLLSLQKTVAKGFNPPASKKKAIIQTIIRHSPDVKQLLERRKIGHKVLSQYLTSKTGKVAESMTKDQLIEEILHLWDSYEPLGTEDKASKSSTSLEKPAEQKSSAGTYTETQEGKELELQRNQSEGEMFSLEFYKILDINYPSTSSGAVGALVGFRPNCSLTIALKTRGEKATKLTYENDVLEHLRDFVKQKKFLFKPGIPRESVRTATNPNGLFVVMVHGTVQRKDNCLGIFEQIFDLSNKAIPRKHRWEIKKTKLKVTYFSRINDTADQDMLSFASENNELNM